jgi:hypothetical protein
VLYHNTDPQRQLIGERVGQLKHEMRRVRPLTPEEIGYPGWTRLARELLGRAERLRGRKGSHDPAFDV